MRSSPTFSSAATGLGSFAADFRRAVVETVYFDFDDDGLRPDTKADLDRQADWILANPEIRFSVTGHTDLVGNVDYNRDLGMRRARAVVAYLVGKGIEEDRLVAMVSMGEDAPAVRTKDREAANRRVETEVIGFFRRGGVAAGAAPAPVEGPLVVASPTPQPGPQPQPEAEPDPETVAEKERGSTANSGRGNGDEGGDPGQSEGKNNGGDETASSQTAGGSGNTGNKGGRKA